MRSYRPIDCNFYDILLDRATRKKEVEIVYSPNGQLCKLYARIVDVFTKNKVEFLQTNDGALIRLDDLISVDEIPRPVDSSCAL